MLQIILLAAVCFLVYFLIMKMSTNGNKSTIFNKKPKIGEVLTMDDTYNEFKVSKKKEVDRILDKIGKRGIDSLSTKEKTFLDGYSK